MPYLGDYIGHLLSEITLARVQSDLEAVRLAELYASHPLLRHMPVPHFRLPTMTLDVPVAIKAMEEAKPGESPRGEVALPVLRERFAAILDAHLQRAKIKPSDAEMSSLDQALDLITTSPDRPPYLSISTLHVGDELVAKTVETLGKSRRPVEAGRMEKLAGELKTAVRHEFASLRTAPPRLLVSVTTAELKESGPHEVLAQLHLSISEEAFQWSVTEVQGKSDNRLVPE
jgi:hypothetical protein